MSTWLLSKTDYCGLIAVDMRLGWIDDIPFLGWPGRQSMTAFVHFIGLMSDGNASDGDDDD